MIRKWLVLAFIVLVFAPIPGLAQQPANCDNQLLPTDQLVCNDPSLFGLEHEILLIENGIAADYDKKAIQKRVEESITWRHTQAHLCQIPASGKIGYSDALRSRSCLLQLYEDKVRKLIDGPVLNCAKTSVTTDLIVCSDFELRLLDGGLNAVYESTFRSSSTEQAENLKARKNEWFSDRATKCGVPSSGDLAISTAIQMRNCLLDIYKAEILVITGSKAAPDGTVENALIGLRAQDPLSRTMAETLTNCFNNSRGKLSIQGMYDCSGYWVTPRTFLSCIGGDKCIVFHNNLTDMETFDSYLTSSSVSKSSILRINTNSIAVSLDPQILENCKSASPTSSDLVGCALLPGHLQRFQALSHCITGSGRSQANCIAGSVDNENISKIVNCVSSPTPSPSEILGCLQDSSAILKAQALASCIAAGLGSEQNKHCVLDSLPADQVIAEKCLLQDDQQSCLKKQFPNIQKAENVVECFSSESDVRACLALQGVGFGGDVEACVSLGSKNASIDCLLRNQPKLQTAYAAWSCVKAAGGSDEGVAACTLSLIPGVDGRTRQAIACVAQSGGNKTRLANCAAASVLPPDVARIVSCGATSTGFASFAVCAASPSVNEEWRIAAECAVESGGVPIAWAGCTAGQLTVRELLKCAEGRIGEDGGCFGPNNTIVKFYSQAFSDIINGPGSNNDVVKALKTIGDGVTAVGAGVINVKAEIQKRTEVRIDAGTMNNVCKNATFGIVGC